MVNALLDSVDDPHLLVRSGCPEGEETTYLWADLFQLNCKGAGKLAQRLIDWGLDPNERLNTGVTPLLIAAHKADAKTLDVIDLLLAAGTDPTVSTEPNLSGQRQREAELDAIKARGQDVSLLPRVLPHEPASVLDLARANRKKTYNYLKSILDVQGNLDRFEVAEAQLTKIRKSECSRRFTEFAQKMETSFGCEAKPVRGPRALLQYSFKLSQLPPSDEEDDSDDCLKRLEPLQAEARDAGALLIYQDAIWVPIANTQKLRFPANGTCHFPNCNDPASVAISERKLNVGVSPFRRFGPKKWIKLANKREVPTSRRRLARKTNREGLVCPTRLLVLPIMRSRRKQTSRLDSKIEAMITGTRCDKRH